MFLVLTILCGRSHICERNACEVSVDEAISGKSERGAKLLVGEIVWTRLRWRRRVDVESGRAESLSFRNPKQKIHLRSSILWRLNPFQPNDFNRISRDVLSFYCKQIRTWFWKSPASASFLRVFLRQKGSIINEALKYDRNFLINFTIPEWCSRYQLRRIIHAIIIELRDIIDVCCAKALKMRILARRVFFLN